MMMTFAAVRYRLSTFALSGHTGRTLAAGFNPLKEN